MDGLWFENIKEVVEDDMTGAYWDDEGVDEDNMTGVYRNLWWRGWVQEVE